MRLRVPTVGCGFAHDEVGDRHRALRRLDAELVEGGERTTILGQAQADVDRIVDAGGAVFGQFEAGGHQLHGRADRARRDAVLGSLAAIDVERPVDAGRRQAVVDVDDARNRRQHRRDVAGRLVQVGRVGGRQAHLDGLAGRRTGFRHAHFDVDAGNAGHRRAQVGQHLMRGLALAPVDELVLDDADDVLGGFSAAATRLADAGVDRLQAGPAENALFRDLGGGVHFGERKVAAGMDIEQAVIGLDIGEEFDAGAPLRIGHLHADQQGDGQEQRGLGEADGGLDRLHVKAVAPGMLVLRMRLADDRADGRGEHQRIEHRRRQRDDQRDRQIFHELADDARPEQQRREGGDARHRRGDDRPGHALRGKRERLLLVACLPTSAVRRTR